MEEDKQNNFELKCKQANWKRKVLNIPKAEKDIYADTHSRVDAGNVMPRRRRRRRRMMNKVI